MTCSNSLAQITSIASYQSSNTFIHKLSFQNVSNHKVLALVTCLASQWIRCLQLQATQLFQASLKLPTPSTTRIACSTPCYTSSTKDQGLHQNIASKRQDIIPCYGSFSTLLILLVPFEIHRMKEILSTFPSPILIPWEKKLLVVTLGKRKGRCELQG